jgi:hypothetical protein
MKKRRNKAIVPHEKGGNVRVWGIKKLGVWLEENQGRWMRYKRYVGREGNHWTGQFESHRGVLLAYLNDDMEVLCRDC